MIFITVTFLDYMNSREFAINGIPVMATVIDSKPEQDVDSEDNYDRSQGWNTFYSFQDKNGQSHVYQAPSRTPANVPTGTKKELLYDTNNPDRIAESPMEPNNIFENLLGFAGFLILLVGIQKMRHPSEAFLSLKQNGRKA